LSRGALAGAAIVLAALAAVAFAGVAIHELQYASDHRFAYGPAKVIATAAGAGVLVSLAVAALALAAARDR
jgi:hypothetical protein